MIGRWSAPNPEQEEVGPRSFDDFDLRLGDVMRGERATMGKSLLDVQRELRIKASYIAAIENADPSAFDTPGFIAGYVRSYARYLGMDPDTAFRHFCEESGFSVAHGMSSEASSIRKSTMGNANGAKPSVQLRSDPFQTTGTPFLPETDSFLSRIEPGAVGSMLVMLGLIGAIGFGGYSVLREIQQVNLVPVDQTPEVLAALDPLDTAAPGGANGEALVQDALSTPTAEALDRLYRPQALDVPVLIARDAPISTLDPSSTGTFARADRPRMADESAEDRFAQYRPGMTAPEGVTPGEGFAAQTALATAELGQEGPRLPQVVDALGPGVTIVAVRPAWVRVRAADGSSIYEKIMEPGDTYAVPQTEDPARITVGESGAIYFAINGQTFGPAGNRGAVTRNLALDPAGLQQSYQTADIAADTDLAKVVAELTTPVTAD